jgi:chromatin remodeling complex protein RSC6
MTPRATKTPTQAKTVAAAVADTAPVAATAPAKKSASKKKSVATADVTAPDTVASPVENVVTSDVVTVSEVDVLESVTKLQEFGAKIQQLAGIIAALKQDYKTLDKVVSREIKVLQKNSKKRKANSNRQPSGFVKPTLISKDLAKFLGKEDGVEMARTEVSKEINQYIRANSLQDKDNGRIILADDKLKKLLNLSDSDELTYFNLQRYMKHHFIKTDVAASVSA